MMKIEEQIQELLLRPLPAYLEISEQRDASNFHEGFPENINKLCEVLRCAKHITEKNDRNVRPIIYIDFGTSDTMEALVTERYLREKVVERELLYLIETDEFLNTSGELYAKHMAIPANVAIGCRLTFACFRDKESLANDWEYSVGLYLDCD